MSLVLLYCLAVVVFFLDSYSAGIYSLIIALLCTVIYKKDMSILSYELKLKDLRKIFAEIQVNIQSLTKDNKDLKELNDQLKQQIIELCPELAPRPRTRFKELPDGPPPEDEKS